MLEENKYEIDVTEPPQEALDSSSEELVNDIIRTNDINKVNDLTTLFNQNLQKKNLVRQLKFSKIIDKANDEIIERLENDPKSISNKDLIQFVRVAQDSGKSDNATPPIQISEAHVTIDNGDGVEQRTSRENIIKTVTELLKSMDNNKDFDIKENAVEAEFSEIEDYDK